MLGAPSKKTKEEEKWVCFSGKTASWDAMLPIPEFAAGCFFDRWSFITCTCTRYMQTISFVVFSCQNNGVPL